jgi:hypothetical protein
MAMRSSLPLAALLALGACGSFGQLRSSAPEPAAYDQFVPAGARVKAIVRGGGVVEGTLLSRFRREGPDLVICQAALCAGPASPDVRTVPVDSLQRLQVWGRRGGMMAMLGLYTGAVAGALADDREDGGTMLLGGLAGVGLGYVIGSLSQGWNVAIPCVHLCGGWQTERPPAGQQPSKGPGK